MLDFERGGLWDLISIGEENETLSTRVKKHLSNKHVLKVLREARKEKSKREQYPLKVDLES